MPKPNPVRILADRCGGASTELKERLKQQRKQEKAMRATLAGGAKSVAEIAEVMQMDTRDVLWLLMALKKYGEVVEAEQQGNVYTYMLKT